MMRAAKNIVYSLIDVLTLQRGIPRRINGHTVHFPARWSKYFEDDYEKENIAFLTKECRAGMRVIDVGAHIGLVSVTCGKIVSPGGTVYAFEPTPGTFRILEKVISINGLKGTVIPVNKAVSKDAGTLDFYVDEQNEGSNANSLVSVNHRERKAMKIDVVSLDYFVKEQKLDRLDIIKIDAEGIELDVLQGAMQCIARFRPKIILAVHPSLIRNHGQSVEQLYSAIEKLGSYDLSYQEKPLGKEEFCRQPDFFDVHLVPRH